MNASDLLDVSPAVMFEHVRNQRIAAGRLMKPTEVQDALSDQSDLPAAKLGWYLCGNVHPDMYPSLQTASRTMRSRVVVFPTSSGRQYLVVGQQVGVWEHRFVLPLLGSTVAEFVRSLEGHPLRLSLSTGSEGMALVTEIPICSEEAHACNEAVGELDAPLEALFRESAAAAVSMLIPNAWETGEETSDGARTCVTLVAHPIITDALSQSRPLAKDMVVH